jgi:hypothetical protein
MQMKNEERKLAELILYISQKYANDPNYGSVKLNKALFFPDFNAYASWGRTITEAEYQHQPEGPTLLRMLPVLEALKDERAIAIQPVQYFGYPQKRPVNLRDPDLIHFSGKEIALVDAWLERLRPMNAREVSEYSHETAGWRTTKNGEIIRPQTVFIGWSKPSAAEILRGQELAATRGLLVKE